MLRTASNLTQSGLAELLGVSRQAVVGWEAGSSRPSAHHLQHLIELCLQCNAFHRGQKAEEIRAWRPGVRVRGRQAIIWGLSWSPNGRWLASCGEGSTIRIFGMRQGSKRARFDAS